MKLRIVEQFSPLFDKSDPNYNKRYIVYHGGRASLKSTNAAQACLIRGWRKREKILCARQFQNSIKDSVMSILEEEAVRLGLQDFYKFQRDGVSSPHNGTDFIFAGLHNNLPSIRSKQGISLCWVEEGQAVTQKALDVLIPTVRKPGSQFIFTYNTDLETDPVYLKFNVNPPPNAIVTKINYNRNPYFTDVLREEMEWCRATDTDAYMHIWEGFPRVHSAAQIFNGKWEIGRFEPPPGVEFMHGVDFGFSVDPTTAVRCYIHEGSLWVYQEAYKHKLDIDDTAAFFMKEIPQIEKFITRADSARPETISYLQRHGLPDMVGVDKWPGSVEDGIAVLRSFKKIMIHESCAHTIQEMKLYSYKIHAQTGDILPEVADKHNHLIDALRYALAPIIQQSGAGQGFLHFLSDEYKKKIAEEATKPVIVNTRC